MESLVTLADRIKNSVEPGNSCSIEWIKKDARAGGHTSHLGRAFYQLGFEPTLIGTYGKPPKSIFTEELDDCTLCSLGDPSHTDAVEFKDGKLMLNDMRSLTSVNWDLVCEQISVKTLAEKIDGPATLSTGYWATMPFLPSIWHGLTNQMWPLLNDPPRLIFIHPADIRRLSKDRLRVGIESLSTLNDTVPVTISANRAETKAFASLGGKTGSGMREQALTAKEILDVNQFVTHTSDRALLIEDDQISKVKTPVVEEPTLTTSAGDQFNVGFLLGQILAVDGPPSLVLGNALANWFVRYGTPPTYDELVDFLSTFDELFK